MADQEPEGNESAPGADERAGTGAGAGDGADTTSSAGTGAGAAPGAGDGPEPAAPATPDDPGPGPGVDAVRWFGVLGTGLFILAAIAAVIWGLVEIVPDLVPVPDGNTPAAERDLLIAVALAGALGGLIHSARSFYWYVGNRELRRSWLLMYYLRPLAGAALAAVFYLVIRGGFIPEHESGNSLAFLALAALVGLFSDEAVLKLKEIAENVFRRAPQGKDAEPQVKPADQVEAEDRGRGQG